MHKSFSYSSLDDLTNKIKEGNFEIPLCEDTSILSTPLIFNTNTIKNRLAILPMEGCDGKLDGSPDFLTKRRYERFAKSGAGLIWFEAVAAANDGRANPRQLYMHKENVDVFKDSVYPKSQTGMTGMAVSAGAALCNLQHQQYGISSTKFRWNLSGTYQQVLPRYVSVDENGNEYEFLTDYFKTPEDALNAVFLKGYQWPFDSSKVFGSSIIDIIIYTEINVLNRKVYLDYQKNPKGLENGFDLLSDETYNYLKNSNALKGRPIDRLKIMNPKAIDLFLDNHIDLSKELLEINVTSQHINGGISIDENWQSSIKGLYAVGEIAGNFGISRPGGSALNATQVGSFRAAEHIALNGKNESIQDEKALEKIIDDIKNLYDNIKNMKNKSNLKEKSEYFKAETSKNAAFLRNENEMKRLYSETLNCIKNFYDEIQIFDEKELPSMFQFRDTLYMQAAMLVSCIKSAEIEGSCGGSIVLSAEGEIFSDRLKSYKYKKSNIDKNVILETKNTDHDFITHFKAVRPIPKADTWFESVWSDYVKRYEKNKI